MPVVADTLESIVDRALVRIRSPNDATTLGTGFFVSHDGLVVTCHHVVAAHDEVRVETADGAVTPAAVHPEDLFSALDLAVLRTGRRVESPLSLSSADLPFANFWAKGFQFEDLGLRQAVPVRGETSGHTLIEYVYGETAYSVPVLVLNRGDLDGGLSGGPVVEPETGSVFGVVVAHLPGSNDIRGFAVPLARAVQKAPAIAEILTANDRMCPRFGRRLNALGARWLCRQQTEAAVKRLEQQRLYLPDRCSERAGLRRHMEEFRHSDHAVLPIVGYAGVGKTTAIAHVASAWATDAPVLLLRGQNISARHSGLADLIDEVLAMLAADEWRETSRAKDVAAVLAAEGEPLTVLLDALNEARVEPRDLVELWVPQTLAWLTHVGARLIVTCRPEVWELLETAFASISIYTDQGTEGCLRQHRLGVALDDFSPDEAAAALKRYGFTATDDLRHFRHPFAVRVYWEVAAQPARNERVLLRHPRLSAAIERWVDEKCRKVALALGQQNTPRRVRGLVDEFAKVLLENGTSEITFACVDASYAGQRELVHGLVQEHLLTEGANSYRFAFDSITEYLQSAHIQLADLLHPATFLAEPSEVRTIPQGVAIWAFTRLQNAGRTAELQEALQQLADWLRGGEAQKAFTAEIRNPLRRDSFHLVSFAIRVLKQLECHSEVERDCVDLLLSCAALDVESAEISYWINREKINISPRAELQVIRALLPAQGWYGWRAKDWQDPRRRRPPEHWAGWGRKLGCAIRDLLDREPALTLQTLVDWLGDESPLEEVGITGTTSEATIGDLAATCLFHFRNVDFEWICRNVTRGHYGRGLGLLHTFAETDASRLLPVLDSWFADPMQEQLAMRILRHLYDQHRTANDPDRAQALDLLTRAVDTAHDPGVRLSAAAAVAMEPALQERVWPVLRDAFRSGVGAPSPNTFRPFLTSRFAEVLELFRERLATAGPEQWRADGRAWPIISVLAMHRESVEQNLGAIVALLREGLDCCPDDSIVSLGVETILYKVSMPNAEASGLLDLATVLIQKGSDRAREHLMYVAYPTAGKDPPVSPWLRALFAEHISGLSNIEQVIRWAATACQHDPAVFEQIRPFAKRLDREEWEWLLLFAGLESDTAVFRSLCEAEWRSKDGGDLGIGAKVYLKAIDGGAPPEDAALEAIEALTASS